MFTENITTWAIEATSKNHDFYILILCVVWQIWASWYPKVPGQYGQHPLQDGPIQQSNQVLQDGSWSGLVVFLIFIFMFEGNFVRCQIRTKQCASRLCTTLGSSLSKWVRLVLFYPFLVKSIVRTFILSLCRSIQRCLLLFWMDHVRAGNFIFFKFPRGDNLFPPSHPKRAFSSAKTTAQYTSSKTRATSKPASTWSCVTTPPETKTGWRRASHNLWRFRLRFEVPCDETVAFSAM